MRLEFTGHEKLSDYEWGPALLWNSPRYARSSHMLHHRCTMVRGMDPECDLSVNCPNAQLHP